MKKDRFDKVVEEAYPILRGLVRRRITFDSEDLLQDTLLQIYAHKDWLKLKSGTDKSVRGFLCKRVWSRIIDRYRKSHKREPLYGAFQLEKVDDLMSYDLVSALDKAIDAGISLRNSRFLDDL